MIGRKLLGRLRSCPAGSMAIETALVAPMLVTLAIGAFEGSSIIARQHELQSAASDAETIAMTAGDGVEAQLSTITAVLIDSVGLTEEQIVLERKFRCDTDEIMVTSKQSCSAGAMIAEYLVLDLTDRYEPVWTQFGIGSPVDFRVTRTIQVG